MTDRNKKVYPKLPKLDRTLRSPKLIRLNKTKIRPFEVQDNKDVIEYLEINENVVDKVLKHEERRPTVSEIVSRHVLKRKKKTRVLSIVPQIKVHESNNDQPKKNPNFKKSWKLFCNTSTLDGMHLIGGTKNVSYSKISLVMLIMATACATYLCYDNLRLYLRYNLRTTISYETNVQLPFPALTFCNVNKFKRSVVGVSEGFKNALMFAYGKNVEETPTIQNENNWTCPSVAVNKAALIADGMVLLGANGGSDVKPLYQTFSQNAGEMVKKCWWNNVEIDCKRNFANHILDFTNCFTYNQNSSDLDTMASVVPVFGMEGVSYVPRTVVNPRQGFQLLLDVQQHEYCGSPVLRSGAGLRLLIHDTHAQTSLSLLPAISLSPGFEYTVTMQPVMYDLRKFSESLGRCTSNVYNPMREENEYDQPSCFMACLSVKCLESCKCVPIQTRLFTDALRKFVGHTETPLRTCDALKTDDFFCMVDVYSKYESNNPDTSCPKCIRKCYETKYEYELSAKRLSTVTMLQNVTNNMKKNLIIALFNFEGMTSIHIKETQLFTIRDLFIYWGNILGLFLGFSFVTLYEVFHQLIYSMQILHRQHKTKLLTCLLNAIKRKDTVKKKNRRPSVLFL